MNTKVACSPVATAVRSALAGAETRADAVAALARKLPGRLSREALMSWLRDDRALGVTITRRSSAGV